MAAVLKLIDDLLLALIPYHDQSIRTELINLKINCSDQCILRFIHKSDCKQLVHAANSIKVAKYLRSRFPNPYKMEDAEWWINHNECLLNKYIQIAQKTKNGQIDHEENEFCELTCFNFQIVEKETNYVIGGIGVESHSLDEHIYEIGYWLNEKFWNRGIMTAAIKHFLDFIWNNQMSEDLTLTRIIRIDAHVAITNKASMRLLQKSGFQKEGIHRKAHRLRDGSYVDSCPMSTLDEAVSKSQSAVLSDFDDKALSEHLESQNWQQLPSLTALKAASSIRKKDEESSSSSSSIRVKIKQVIDTLWLQTCMILLVVFDFIIGLSSIIESEETKSIITLVIILIYLIEIAFRIYAETPTIYFRSVLDVIDFIAVVGSLLLYIFAIYIPWTLLVKMLRWVRVIRTAYRAIFSRGQKIQRAIRQLQRSKLIGYRDDKFDLDIAYITDHILIMSQPTTHILKQYKGNPLSQIKAFLDEKHKDSYRIYDLCVYEQKKNAENTKNNDLKIVYSNTGFRRTLSEMDEFIKLSFKDIITNETERYDDDPQIIYDAFGKSVICNDFGFESFMVLSMKKIFEYAETATRFADDNPGNVIILQSTSGLGRTMFLTVCLLYYYHPTSALRDIVRFVRHERISVIVNDNGKAETVEKERLFDSFMPSQTRYLQYFVTLISHCYRMASDEKKQKEDEEEAKLMEQLDGMNAFERTLTVHMKSIHHNQQSMMKEIGKSVHNEVEKSEWYFYHKHAMNMLDSKIGVVIKQIAIYNYFDEIDPYANWEADIFQWSESNNAKDDDDVESLRFVKYDTMPYGIDDKPGKNSALIKRFEEDKPRVLEKDFGVRLYHSTGNTKDRRQKKRSLIAQIILHSHFISLDDEQCISFKKNEIDFVNKDVDNKYFPADFMVVIRAKILRKVKRE